jgi:hypothetical protein
MLPTICGHPSTFSQVATAVNTPAALFHRPVALSAASSMIAAAVSVVHLSADLASNLDRAGYLVPD